MINLQPKIFSDDRLFNVKVQASLYKFSIDTFLCGLNSDSYTEFLSFRD